MLNVKTVITVTVEGFTLQPSIKNNRQLLQGRILVHKYENISYLIDKMCRTNKRSEICETNTYATICDFTKITLVCTFENRDNKI